MRPRCPVVSCWTRRRTSSTTPIEVAALNPSGGYKAAIDADLADATATLELSTSSGQREAVCHPARHPRDLGEGG